MSKSKTPGKAKTTEDIFIPSSITFYQWEQLDDLFRYRLTFEDFQFELSQLKRRYLTLYLESDESTSIEKLDVLSDIMHLDFIIDMTAEE